MLLFHQPKKRNKTNLTIGTSKDITELIPVDAISLNKTYKIL